MSIEFKSVTKLYRGAKGKALDTVSFSVRNGEILGYAGLNGAGKTTSIRISAGVIFPTSGDVLVDGLSIVSNKRKSAEEIAWVPETANIDYMISPSTLFLEYGSYYGFSRRMSKDRMKETMDFVGLGDHINHRVGTFSNGMKKRLLLAIAIFQGPNNYLLDETFTGLDPEGIRLLKNILFELKSQGRSILLSSHVLPELEEVVDRVAIIHRGRIIDVCNLRSIPNRTTFEIKFKGDISAAMSTLEQLGQVTEEKGTVFFEPKDWKTASVDEIKHVLSENDLVPEYVRGLKNGLERYFFEKIGEN